MNYLDIGVVAIILLSAVFAFARGFVREVFSVIAWVGAAVIALYAFGWAYDQIDPYVHNPLVSQVIAGFGLFVVSLIVLTMATGILARTISMTAFSPIDRTLGFVFGLARGMFLVCLAYLLVAMALPPSDWPPWLRDAKSGPYLSEGADLLKGFLPESLKLKSADLAPQPVDPAVEAKRAMRAFETPGAIGQAGAGQNAESPRYRQQNQRQLDRMIDSQR